MHLKDHGAWRRYIPEVPSPDAPVGTLYARRAGDNVDWYDYVRASEHFAETSVKMTVLDGVVMAATTDPTALFPGNTQVLEVSDVSVDDPQKTFGGLIYDGKTFYTPPPVDYPDPLAEIRKRLEALEGKSP
jgi:hypothetical protein